jgi:multiple sugar transport system substrate-binding protein
MKPDSVDRIVDWCTKAKSDMPPRKSALEAGKAAFDSGFLKTFTDEIYPGARAEPRMPPPVYKAISDAIQACQLNGQKPEERPRRLRNRSTRSSRTTKAPRYSDHGPGFPEN